MIGKIFKIVVNVILVLLLLCGLLVIFTALPISKSYKLFTVQSGSMEPTIHTGSLIFTREVGEYQIGDIVTRATSDKKVTVTHRIVKEENGEFTTRGDANDGDDNETFTKDKIIGKVYLIIPYLGYPVSFSKTSKGFILIIVIPAVIIIYEELQKIQNEVKKKMDYRKRVKKRKENQLANEEESQENNEEKADEEN